MFPSDNQFKSFFEDMYNPPDIDGIDGEVVTTPVTIPILDYVISEVEV